MKEKIEARIKELEGMQTQKQERANGLNNALAQEREQLIGIAHRIDELKIWLKTMEA